jgi:NADH-quinone oxidoreductase subunit C
VTDDSEFLSKSISPEEAAALVSGRFPEVVKVVKTAPRRLWLTADRSVILKLCNYMKDELGFHHASCVSGVDRCDRFQVVYHITSYQADKDVTAEIVVDLPHDDPRVDSVTPLWGGANWHEREAYDMFGIIFVGHPRLERFLLPSDYQYFPMRRKCEGGKE